jgi:hypothetical protein
MKNFTYTRKMVLVMVSAVLSLLMITTAHAGKIVLSNDEWNLSDYGFTVNPINDPVTYASNVAGWFTGGGAGSFLAYSGNFGLTGNSLASAMTSAGNTWIVSMADPFTLATLLGYDGVFLAGNPVDNHVLIDYVIAGGNVYLAGGTGYGGAAAEAAQWNTFLNAFGLGFGSFYNGVGGNISISSPHPIFANVDHLYQNNGNDTLDIIASDPRAQVLLSLNGHGLYAVYDSGPVAAPEPATFLLIGAGLAGAGFLRKMIKK